YHGHQRSRHRAAQDHVAHRVAAGPGSFPRIPWTSPPQGGHPRRTGRSPAGYPDRVSGPGANSQLSFPPANSTNSTFPWQLARVLRDRFTDVERGGDDPVLLHRMGDRVTLARGCALRPPDIAELELLGQHLQQSGRHERPRTHVARLLLDPYDLAQFRVTGRELEDLGLRERVQQLNAADRPVGIALALGVPEQVVVDLAGAQGQPGDPLGV